VTKCSRSMIVTLRVIGQSDHLTCRRAARPAMGGPRAALCEERLRQRLCDRRSTVPRVNASRRALLLIRYVRLSGGEEPPDDACQNGDDRGDHWADGRARLGRPRPDVAASTGQLRRARAASSHLAALAQASRL
jgi:hypothetical protein